MEPVKDSYEEGVFFGGVNTGDVDWFITETDGYQSDKSAKCPFILEQGDKAILQYNFSPANGKEITVEFYCKYIDENASVSLGVSSSSFDYFPPLSTSFKKHSFTYVSTSTNDYIEFRVDALSPEANPLIVI